MFNSNFMPFTNSSANVFGLQVASMSDGNRWGDFVDVRGNVVGKSNYVIDIISADRDIRADNRTSDKVKNKAKELGNEALERGREAANAAARAAANAFIPGGAAVTDAIGITGECNWLCQLQEWIKETGIFQRLAIAILAFVFIATALAMLGRSGIVGNVASVVKGK